MKKEVGRLLNSKYTDLVIAIFMAIFAYINFTNGRTGLVVLFIALSFANLLTAYIKHQRLKKESEN